MGSRSPPPLPLVSDGGRRGSGRARSAAGADLGGVAAVVGGGAGPGDGGGAVLRESGEEGVDAWCVRGVRAAWCVRDAWCAV